MNSNQSILTKQQLFVNPIAILQKQKSKQPQSSLPTQINFNNQTHTLNDTQNFNQLLLHAVDPQAQDLHKDSSKSKGIKKPVVLSTSTQNNKQKHYRTRMCPEGLQCRKRLVCHFAHTQYELRRPYKNRKNPCLRYQKGLCNLAAACPDYHGNMDLKKKNYKYKTQKCQDWHEKGTCPKGKLCIFIHNEDENENDESQNSENGQNIELQENVHQIGEQLIKQNSHQSQKHVKIAQHELIPKHQDNHMLKPKDIFSAKTQNKKPVLIKEVVEEKIETKQQGVQQNQNEEQNFNIEFNF